jgi:branched-chain amino acid transport system ATP-binding protein
LISGVLSPTAGRIVFNGKDVTGWSPHKISRAGLARSFQITNLFADLKVVENLRLGAQALDIKSKSFMPIVHKRKALEKVEELLERFALTNKAYELAGTLSHGDQRRLEIAVALAGEPELLLLDEPTQGMSHGDTVEIAELIRKTARDISVLLIEHDIDMVMDLSDWVVVMHLGAKLSEGSPDTVRADSAVRKAYLGEA